MTVTACRGVQFPYTRFFVLLSKCREWSAVLILLAPWATRIPSMWMLLSWGVKGGVNTCLAPVEQEAAQAASTVFQDSAAFRRNAATINYGIAETIIESHTGMKYHVEHNAQGTPPHHGFSPVSVC